MEWVSVKDKLPDEDGFCIIHYLDEGEFWVGEGYFFTETEKFDCHYAEFPFVTHWMSMPAPPEGK